MLLHSQISLSYTYYVSSIGNNEDSGSLSLPWRTIQHAIDNVNPGDLIIVEDGEYLPFHITHSGNESQKIIIKARNKHKAIITGSEYYDKRDAGIHITADFINIDGFNIKCTGISTSKPGERGIRLSGSPNEYRKGVIIQNNKVTGAEWVGISTSYADDTTIQYNDISKTIIQHGIYIANSADRPVIRGNIIHDNNQAGIHMNGDGENPGDGVISNALIENNIIYNNTYGPSSSAINLDGVEHSIIRNNLLFNNHSQGISNFKGDGKKPSSHNKILNNTIVMSSSAHHALKFRNGSVYGYVRNNIIIQQGNGYSLAVDNLSMPGLDSDYNIIIHTTSPNQAVENFKNLSHWKEAENQDKHSFSISGISTENILNKLFVNPVNDDSFKYHLISTSPAIDMGQVNNDAHSDINEYNRPSGLGFDIGAYEFGATDSLAIPTNIKITRH